MKKMVVMAALLLGGCASVERPQMHLMQHAKPKMQTTVPVIVTPNDQVKHRWYEKFKHHPKFFHQ